MANSYLKLTEYYEFTKWYATPRAYRNPQTQGEFSEQYKVSGDTLARWKSDPQFEEDVRRVWTEWTKNLIPDVIGAMYNNAMRGDFKSAEYLLNNFAGLSTKVDNRDIKEIGDNLASVLLDRAKARENKAHALRGIHEQRTGNGARG